MRPLVPTGQRFLASEVPFTGALKPIDQHMQEELMRGTDLSIQLLLSQIQPKLLGKRGSLPQVVILGIDASEVVSFGDGQNDKSMIEWAGTGVAMGNAVDEVKAVAQMVTANNNEDGIAVALDKLLG